MASTKPMPGLPSASELVPFAHGAAGHEGVSSNASGSLVIKPCTQAEIDFYESAKDHPEFQAHMPTFMGSLTLNNDQSQAQPLQQQQPPPQIPDATSTSTSESRKDGEAGIANASTSSAPQDTQPKEWIPSGGKQLSTSLAIVLENAAAGFTHPCVLDLKLGARLWDDDAPEAKRQRLDQVANETTSGSLGFRVAGMKVWLADSTDSRTIEVNTDIKEGYKSFNKVYGRNLTVDNVQEAFIRVLGGRQSSPSTENGKSNFKRARATLLLRRFLREVQSIRYVLENQESRMYSASILLVVEGDDEALEAGLVKEKSNKGDDDDDDDDDVEGGEDEDKDEDDDDEDDEIGPKVLEVRLIDFAHASWTPGQGPDENALRGVRSVQKILEDLLESTS